MTPVCFLFDLDGVVTVEESFTAIDRELGLGGVLAAATHADCSSAATAEEYAEGFRKRLALLEGRSVTFIARIVEAMKLYDEVSEFIAANASRCLIVSSNLGCFCAPLAARIGAPAIFSDCRVEADRIVGMPVMADKSAVVESLRSEGKRVVMIGDGANDLDAMRRADISIAAAYAPSVSPAVAAEATLSAPTPAELVAFLQRLI